MRPPGEAEVVKEGVATLEPEPVVSDGHYRLNVDKDASSGMGERNSAMEIGDIATSSQQCTGEVQVESVRADACF